MIGCDVPVEHPQFGKLFPCTNPDCPKAQEQRQRRFAGLLQHSGLPAKYARMTFNTWYSLPKAQRAGKELAAACAALFAMTESFSLDDAATADDLPAPGFEERRGWLVLQGPVGVGKTGLAAASMNEMLLRGRAALYYRLGDLFADVQRGYKPNAAVSADDLLEAVKTAPALFIDEMNVPKASDDKLRIVEELVRYRHGRELPTCITCNVSPADFVALWGERTADVLFEQSHWIVLRGERLRRSAEIQESF
jgi:DNA replication protein DnaC